jgi:hypothetical protein
MEISSHGWRFPHIFTSCPRAAAVIALLACQVAEIPASCHAMLLQNIGKSVNFQKSSFFGLKFCFASFFLKKVRNKGIINVINLLTMSVSQSVTLCGTLLYAISLLAKQ